MQENKPLLIVGLGNPGTQFAQTRHNAGFMAVDALAGAGAVWKKEKKALTMKTEILGGDVSPLLGGSGAASPATRGGSILRSSFQSPPHRAPRGAPPKRGGTQLPTILAKPQTFMNLSGQAVQALMTFYKIPLENLIVIHDDMDLPLGTVREKTGGGSAGHNGIKSIDAAVGNEYKRIRIGIGHPPSSASASLRRDPGATSPLAPTDENNYIDPSDWVTGKFSAGELEKINEVIKKITE